MDAPKNATIPKGDTIEDVRKAAAEIQEHLNEPTCKHPERLSWLYNNYGMVPAVRQIISRDYDRRAVHSGFGHPNCTCFRAPPCNSCVEDTVWDPEGDPDVEAIYYENGEEIGRKMRKSKTKSP